MKKIEDYLHLYGLGTEVMFDGKRWKVIHIKRRTIRIVRIVGDEGYNKWNECNYEECKMILRLLPSMTDEECLVISKIFGNASHLSEDGQIAQIRELFASNGYYNKVTNITGNGWNKSINYCRKQGIDMDGLIDAGLAIDKTTQP